MPWPVVLEESLSTFVVEPGVFDDVEVLFRANNKPRWAARLLIKPSQASSVTQQAAAKQAESGSIPTRTLTQCRNLPLLPPIPKPMYMQPILQTLSQTQDDFSKAMRCHGAWNPFVFFYFSLHFFTFQDSYVMW